MQDKNKEYLLKIKDKIVVGVILITYIFILLHLSDIWTGISSVSGLLSPFVLGFVIAYLINPLIIFIKKLWLKIFKKPCKNGIAMALSYLFVIGVIVFLFINILPQVWMSIDMIITQIPHSIESAYLWLETEGDSYLLNITNNKIAMQDILDMLIVNLETMFTNFGDSVSKLLNTTATIVKYILNGIFGVLISIYMLMHKEMYKGQMKKGIFAFFNESHANDMLEFWSSVNNIFSRFIVARIVDSTIIGILCWIGCLILGFDNALLIAFIVGVTNVIPYFGPFIGAVPSALIVLLQSPMDMIIFIIFILILQQFDGNILGPKLLGDSLGLTSFWIIFAVAIMAGIFGVVGMVIGVPLFTVIYVIIKDYVNERLNKKGKSTNTDDYIEDISKN